MTGTRIWQVALMSGILGGALGVSVAVASQSLFQKQSSGTDSVLAVSGDASELAIDVANLRLAQQRLQAELGELRGAMGRGLSEDAVGSEGAVAQVPATNTAARPRRPGGVVTTAQALIIAGVSEPEADSMIARLDALALARLEANYQVRQASADGGSGASQARLDRRAIPPDSAAIRQEFGDTAYDQYLYASEQPNRVSVASVLRESSAQGVGVETGDYLRSLDGEPLYSVRDLTQRVQQGSPEQTYSLVVERNGQTIETWVPGGPLGVRVSAELVEPGS